MNTKTFSGTWQVPSKAENETRSFSGVLSITENGIITLVFTVDDSEKEKVVPGLLKSLYQINNQIPIPLITGIAKDLETYSDQVFSLFNLEIKDYTSSNLMHISLEAQYCFKSLKVNTIENLKFQLSMMKFEGMDTWFDINGFEIKSNSKTNQLQTTVKFTQPEPIDIFISEKEKAYIYFRASSPILANTNKITINQSVFLNWENDEPKSLIEIINFSDRLQNFFSFISYYPARRLKHQISLLKGKYDPEKPKGFLNLDFYYKDRASHFKDHSKKDDFLFTYSKFGDQSKEILANWFIIYEKYSIALDQYFDMKYNNNLHVNSKLITMTSILEIMYVKIYNKDPRDLSLKLNELIKTKKEIFCYLPISKNNLVEQIVAVRKYFVHGKESIHFIKVNTSDRSMLWLSFQLENIIKIYILSELGISDDDIIKIINYQPWKWGEQ